MTTTMTISTVSAGITWGVGEGYSLYVGVAIKAESASQANKCGDKHLHNGTDRMIVNAKDS